jgi:Mg-chelatase subunit ChlD
MNTNSAHIVLLLDNSGSIDAIIDDAIGGCNRFIADQKEINNATLSLILFSDNREIIHSRVPIGQVPELTRKTYPIRGCTALLDAFGSTILETAAQMEALPESERPAKVIFVVFTDGEENSSREFSRNTVFELITKQRGCGWEFVFLGANQDAIQEGCKLGIDAGSALTVAPTGAGTHSAFACASNYVQSYYAQDGPPPSFSDEDREAQEKLAHEWRKQWPSRN